MVITTEIIINNNNSCETDNMDQNNNNNNNNNHNSDNNNMNKKTIGHTVRSVLLRAQVEKRVIIGFTDVVNILSKTPEDAIFCFLATPKLQDYASHMHKVLLEAFCYENDIYIVRLDNAEKLSRLVGSTKLQYCALIQKTFMADHQTENLTNAENLLVDHCEELWDVSDKPIICIPE